MARRRLIQGFVHRIVSTMRMAVGWGPKHTGLSPAVEPHNISFLKLATRIRKVLERKHRPAGYAMWHTGLSPAITPHNVSLLRLVTRAHKVLDQIRRPASYPIWHTGLEPAIIPSLSLSMATRPRHGKAKQGRRMMSFMMPNGHTGLSAPAGRVHWWNTGETFQPLDPTHGWAFFYPE